MWMYPRYASASKFSLLGRICTGGTEFHRRKQARGLLSNQAPAGSSSWQLRIARELCPSGSGVDGCIDKSSDQTHAPAAADAHPKRGCVMCHPLQRRACHRTTCECAARGKADEGTLDLRPATVLPALAARSPVSTLPARCSAATPVGRRCMPCTLRRAAPAPPCTVAHRDCSHKLAQSLTWDVPTGVRRRRLPGLGRVIPQQAGGRAWVQRFGCCRSAQAWTQLSAHHALPRHSRPPGDLLLLLLHLHQIGTLIAHLCA